MTPDIPFNSSNESTLELIICAVFILFTILYAKRRILFGKTGFIKSDYLNNASLVMSFFTQGHKLQLLKRSTIQNLTYNIFLTSDENPKNSGDPNTEPGAILYKLELPFYSSGHIIGISKKSKVERFFLESYIEAHGLIKINLEGDYSDVFSIYATPGQEIISRYILDPKAMAFTIDYCTNFFWEIIGDEMYFVNTKSIKGETNILQDSVKFVEQIRPATADSANNQKLVKHEAPYGEIENKPLNCPICKTTMTVTKYWYACKNQHGILILGRDLINIKKGSLKINESVKAQTNHKTIVCPNCKQEMKPVNYLQKGIIIDSCTNCAFRWLDAGEAKKLSQPKY